jgi:hypothetical protein
MVRWIEDLVVRSIVSKIKSGVESRIAKSIDNREVVSVRKVVVSGMERAWTICN